MCQLLMIDEKPMLDLRQLHWLDFGFCQIFPNTTLFFGRINIALLEDLGQLPAVGERVLYDIRRCIKRVVNMISRQQLY